MKIFNIKVIKALASSNNAILAVIIEDFSGNFGHHRRSGDKDSSNVVIFNTFFKTQVSLIKCGKEN